ncbi:MAG: sigma-54-dependent Fis family transcriptional regulator [Deltaproteobacteria bacterium]|nr:sigma-54-dependent Fis family transcriptional regulator [Deltaproteobacteria bacterium]
MFVLRTDIRPAGSNPNGVRQFPAAAVSRRKPLKKRRRTIEGMGGQPTVRILRLLHDPMGYSRPAYGDRGGSDRQSTGVTQLIGQHPLIQRVHGLITRVAKTDATCLVLGESGTGKELAARSIHGQSKRVDKPFIPVNCGAIPAELLESEMFGHEKGSFTGAVGSRAGMFQLANGGTIFLDEISEMNPVLQVKLLRVLQDQELRPVGADRSMKVDVRVIAATNKDLSMQVERGLFREDLYYRLEVIPINLPPLRERRSDVPLLVRHFLDRHNQKRPEGHVSITEEAMVHLWEYDWPGNVRELENLLERLVILSEDGIIRVENLPAGIRSFISEKKIPKPVMSEEGLDLTHAVEEFENRLIDEALRRTKGNKQAAARLLGLKRTTLVAKLRRRRGGPIAAGGMTES